jgi:CRP-like cAMP-binding protein
MPQSVSPDIIKGLPLFSGLTEQDKDTLLKAGRLHRFTRGEHLFMHGDPIKHFYIVCRGTVQLFRENPDGHEKTTDVRIAGQTIAKAEIFEAVRVHQVNAVAVEDSVVMEFPMAWLKESARKYSAFALNLLSAISKHAREMEVEAEHQATMSAPQLVACFLQRVCILHDFNPCGFELPYSKTLIASRLGMELETFSRTLSKLKEHGITVEGTRVTIHDLGGIDRYVCAHCSVAEDCQTHQILGDKAAERKKSS